MTELSWRWIALMLTGPPIVGVLVAYPFWRHREMVFGNLVGTTVILGTAFALILRESIEMVCDKIGPVLLVLGFMHFGNLSVFHKRRARGRARRPHTNGGWDDARGKVLD